MPHKFGINSPLSVKHISQKAFFKHALGAALPALVKIHVPLQNMAELFISF